METPLRILVTSAGAAPAVAVIKALRQQARYPVVIGAVDMQARSVGMLLADWAELVPGGTDPGFVPCLLDVCRTHQVEYVFPIIDEELPIWAANHERFAAAGVTVFSNPLACVEIARDKHRTVAHCVAHQVAHPRSYQPAEARALPTQAFPLFAKPRCGRGSVGARRIESLAQLEEFLAGHPDGVIQELIEGTEFTVDVLVDQQGELLAAVPKERLEVKSGMATKSITRAAPKVVAFAREVARTFGVRGVANVQAIVDGTGCRLIEVNPKFAASLPLTVAAGVNLPLCLLELARREFSHPTPLPFQADLLMLRCWEEHFVDQSALRDFGKRVA
jgi:carbamoyl-phosphate synthase large subunit